LHELAIRYIELHYIGSYSGYIRVRLARALRKGELSEPQKDRLNQHFLRLVETGNFTAEFKEYKKLWRGIISPEVSFALASLAEQHQGEPRWHWIGAFEAPDESLRPRRRKLRHLRRRG
jgi:hypothetical protein